jgi:hypothetical protein
MDKLDQSQKTELKQNLEDFRRHLSTVGEPLLMVVRKGASVFSRGGVIAREKRHRLEVYLRRSEYSVRVEVSLFRRDSSNRRARN